MRRAAHAHLSPCDCPPNIRYVSGMVPYYGVPLGTKKTPSLLTMLFILYVCSMAQAKYMFFFNFGNLEIQVEAFASISGDLYVHVEAFASLPPSRYAPVTHSPQAQQMSPAPARNGASPHENAHLPRDQIISQTEQVAQRVGNRSPPSVSDYEGTGPTGTAESSESDSEADLRDQQRPKRKLQCDALLIGDSTVKYVEKQRLLGRNMRSYIQRASTTAVVKENTLSWQRDSNVKCVVVHSGVKDVRAGKALHIL